MSMECIYGTKIMIGEKVTVYSNSGAVTCEITKVHGADRIEVRAIGKYAHFGGSGAHTRQTYRKVKK